MKLKLLLTLPWLITLSCGIGQNQDNKLTAKDFSAKIDSTPNAVVLDVRTKSEFTGGHLKNAMNADWKNQDEFNTRIAVLKKDEPLFVYCMGGGRSAAAASKLSEMGFTKVYDLQGGIMAWRAEKLPEEGTPSAPGMSEDEFNALIKDSLPVLIDYYAEWCLPCKKMKPQMEALGNEMKGKIKIVKIDTDKNRDLCAKRGIKGVPVLELFKDGKSVWKNMGYLEKNDIEAEINKHL